jgi:predicted GIY-YIG superfamily endonuclease
MRSELNKSGIYKISNLVNGKFYIGSSKQIRKRWKSHRNSLRKNRHCNLHLQSAVNQYGLDKFLCEVVEEVSINKLSKLEACKLLLKREQFWMDKTNCWDRKIGYNSQPKAGTNLGKKYSQESIERMRQSHIGYKHTKEAKRKISESQYKPVYQIDMSGKIVKRFGSCVEAEKETGVYKQSISMCCRKVMKYARGYQWCYEGDIQNFVSKLPKGCKPIKSMETGKVWMSLKDASQEMKIPYQYIQKWIKCGKYIYV